MTMRCVKRGRAAALAYGVFQIHANELFELLRKILCADSGEVLVNQRQNILGQYFEGIHLFRRVQFRRQEPKGQCLLSKIILFINYLLFSAIFLLLPILLVVFIYNFNFIALFRLVPNSIRLRLILGPAFIWIK